MCGISGYSGEKHYNPYILKLLTLFNQTRGEDSIGIVNDGKLSIGVGYEKGSNQGKAWNFQQHFHYKKEEEITHSKIVLQHNRAKSYGLVNKDSAHPYEYDYEYEGQTYKFYFMHNGTLKKLHLLAQHYNVKYSDYHTDSHMLGDLVLKHGFEPFKLYEGGAACAFYWGHEPNTLFLWKGASDHTYKDNTNVYRTYFGEERPLNYAYSDEGMYFASEAGFLKGVGFNEVFTVPNNKILKFVDSKLVEVKEIEREPLKEKPVERVVVKSHNIQSTVNVNSKGDEYDPRSFIVDKIVYFRNRYWYNSRLLNGVFHVDLDYKILDDASEDSKVLYFINGFWIKDHKEYHNVHKKLKNNSKYVMSIDNDLHPESLVYDENNVYYYNTDYANSKIIKPKFCYFYYVFDSDGKLKRTMHPIHAVESGQISKDQYLCELFNYNMTSHNSNDYYYLSTKKECEDLALSWGWVVELEEHFEDMGVYIKIPEKYKANKKVDINRNSLKEFNVLYNKQFLDKGSANLWYKETYGNYYCKAWPTLIVQK